MRLVLVPLLTLVTAALPSEARDARCPPVDPHRTASQAFAARNAALAAGDLASAFCAYAEDAVVVMPGSVVRGRANVAAAFAGFGVLFGGAFPTITSATEADAVLLITYTLVGPQLTIADGADTFVVTRGRISAQTVHATITPTSP